MFQHVDRTREAGKNQEIDLIEMENERKEGCDVGVEKTTESERKEKRRDGNAVNNNYVKMITNVYITKSGKEENRITCIGRGFTKESK